MQNEAITSSTSTMQSIASACDLLGSDIMELSEFMMDTTPTATLISNEISSSSSSGGATTSSRASLKSSSALLQETIEKLFEDLSDINIENLITFWLTLSTPDCDTSTSGGPNGSSNSLGGSASRGTSGAGEGILYLSESTANYLLDYLNDYPFMTVKLWHLSFRMLTQLLANNPNAANEKLNIARSFTLNEAMYKLVYKFLSSNEELVGDECCQSLVEFLRRFGECIAGVPDSERLFKMKLFHILCSSIEANGCVNRSQGPIDAQVTFIEFLIGIYLLLFV